MNFEYKNLSFSLTRKFKLKLSEYCLYSFTDLCTKKCKMLKHGETMVCWSCYSNDSKFQLFPINQTTVVRWMNVWKIWLSILVVIHCIDWYYINRIDQFISHFIDISNRTVSQLCIDFQKAPTSAILKTYALFPHITFTQVSYRFVLFDSWKVLLKEFSKESNVWVLHMFSKFI